MPHKSSRAGVKGQVADTAAVRGHNLALVLADVRAHQPTLRSEIAERTGLARGSLTTIVPELIEAGLLRESANAAPITPGRPAARLEIDGSRVAVTAIQIGVSDIVVETVDLAERPIRLDREQHGSPQGQPEVIADLAASLLEVHLTQLASGGIECVKVMIVMAGPIIVPSPVIGPSPVVLAAVDLSWLGVDLIALLEARIPAMAGRISLVNDANMAAIAERHELEQGGAPTRNMVYLKSDTGIGGGVIIDGRLLAGSHGVAFEPGHVVVQRDGHLCACGRHGCLVAEIGPEQMLAEAGLSDLTRTSGVSLAIVELVERARANDAKVLAALSRAGRILNSVIEDLSLIFDPDRIVVGGYWSDVFAALHLNDSMEINDMPLLSQAREEDRRGEPFVVPGRLGSRAPRVGAIRYALEGIFANPIPIARRFRT